jgi:NifU-like protein involved in Fe-S cluster formation
MSDALYRKELLRLAADAAGAGRLASPDTSATIHNPTCGDRITIDLVVKDGRIAALAHHTQACVLTQASAAILGADATGLDRSEIAALADSIRAMLKGGRTPPAPFDSYGVFDGVAGHIGRHKCVLLPLEATLEALEVLELAKPGA